MGVSGFIAMLTWLLLTYRIPTEPSAKRVYIWRKLKRMGAILHQDAIWTLPSNSRTLEQFQWLVMEIIEMGGDATLWEASLRLGADAESLIQKFNEQVEAPYHEILEALSGGETDLEALSRQYQQVLSKDYFKSEVGTRVKNALLSLRGSES